MPLALPWLLGALGVGAAGGVWASDRMASTVKWGIVAGAVYLYWRHGK